MRPDDRLTGLLRSVEHPAEPDPAFLDRLYADLSVELGFRARETSSAVPGRRRSERWWLLAAALLALTLAGSAAIAGAALGLFDDGAPADVFDVIRRDGVIHVVVRDGAPQARSAEGTIAGFDVDVARELASRLDVEARVDPIRTGDVGPDGAWQLALGSVLGTAGSDRYRASMPIYYWPVQVIVSRESTTASLTELDGADICVVTGTSGEAWLSGSFDGPSATTIQRPPIAAALTAPDDGACLDALADGTVAAAVTADLGPAELATRGAIRTLDGPVLTEERRAFVEPTASGTDAFLHAIDAAIEAARDDGTLADMARSRFGGHDLSAPPREALQEE